MTSIMAPRRGTIFICECRYTSGVHSRHKKKEKWTKTNKQTIHCQSQCFHYIKVLNVQKKYFASLEKKCENATSKIYFILVRTQMT